jgi:hypothetical protein
VTFAQRSDRFDTAHDRHPQVHQDDIDFQAFDLGQGLLATAGFAEHVELLVAGEYAAQPVAHDRVVIDDEQPDRRHRPAPSGIAALTTVPSPGALSISSVPPTRASR